jgi:hypothetical protein
MMVDRRRKVIIIHTPKCAGKAVQAALGADRVMGRHIGLEPMYKAHPEYRDWPVYQLVRNPFTRLVSWHNYVTGKHASRPPDKNQELVWRALEVSLQQFIDDTDWHEWLRIGRHSVKSHFTTMSYLGTVSGRYHRKIIPIYHERLAEQMTSLFGVTVPYKNVSVKKDVPVWTPQNVARIVDAFREDFIRFEYSMEVDGG